MVENAVASKTAFILTSGLKAVPVIAATFPKTNAIDRNSIHLTEDGCGGSASHKYGMGPFLAMEPGRLPAGDGLPDL